MNKIEISNGYRLLVTHRNQQVHILLEQTLPDGSVILHSEKKLELHELQAFLGEVRVLAANQ